MSLGPASGTGSHSRVHTESYSGYIYNTLKRPDRCRADIGQNSYAFTQKYICPSLKKTEVDDV